MERASDYFNGPVWKFFGLSYSSYLVLPRVALCSMPRDWQEKFVALLEEAHARLPEGTVDGEYWIRRREGRYFVADPLSDYRHPPAIAMRELPDIQEASQA